MIYRHLEEVDDDPGEIYVAHHHDVKVSEELELLQGDHGLPVSLGGVLQVPEIVECNELFRSRLPILVGFHLLT